MNGVKKQTSSHYGHVKIIAPPGGLRYSSLRPCCIINFVLAYRNAISSVAWKGLAVVVGRPPLYSLHQSCCIRGPKLQTEGHRRTRLSRFWICQSNIRWIPEGLALSWHKNSSSGEPQSRPRMTRPRCCGWQRSCEEPFGEQCFVAEHRAIPWVY